MKLKTMFLISAAPFLALSMPLSASSEETDIYTSENQFERISVQWVKPKSFSDVRQANFSSAKFREHVFNQLEEHLNELAADLPAGQTIKFRVTDLDLAGRVEPARFLGYSNSLDDVRIMRNVDIPRIEFEYELLDASGKSISSEVVKLKNMNYLHDISLRYRNRPYEHEKRMLSKWFSQNITDARS